MIGIDLVHIPEFAVQMQNGGDTFLARAFSVDESANRDVDHLAGLWAAKEATTKAAGIEPGRWQDIILRMQPPMSATVDGIVFEISISHHGDYAVAVASGPVL